MSLENPVVTFVTFTLVCAFVGWITNVLAVKMIFRPYKPWRFAGLAYQGVLPKHQRHFAEELANVITRDFMTTGEMVSHLRADKLIANARPILDRLTERFLDDVRAALPEERRAFLQPAMIDAARVAVLAEIEKELEALLGELRTRADGLVDLNTFVADRFFAIGPKRLEAVIYAVSRNELFAIEYFGGIFGAVLGAVQFFFAAFVDMRWSLVLVGAIVGTVTNWLAIQMLFNPRHPKKFWFITIQGLFPKRQTDIAFKMGEIAAAEFIVPREIFELLADRAMPKTIVETDVEKLEAIVAERMPGVASAVTSLLGDDGMRLLRARLVAGFPALREELCREVADVAASHIDIHKLLHDKVASLSKSTFERLLRGLFSKEEFYLIIYGTLLGALIGLIQLGITVALN
ncbi:MAG: DUF445 family protein [Deltaproteobacteria bacterium]|nr:DUF445 family protein [Deltaproteobacteria bacterium]